MMKVSAMVMSTLMPMSLAVSRSSDVARMALPRRVARMKAASPTMRMRERATMKIQRYLIWAPAMVIDPSGNSSG